MRRAVDHSVVVVKAALARCRVARITELPVLYPRRPKVSGDMPFAGHERPIARWPQSLGDCRGIRAQETLVSGSAEIGAHMADASLVRIESSQERRTGRAA